jgi:hypothetical protein
MVPSQKRKKGRLLESSLKIAIKVVLSTYSITVIPADCIFTRLNRLLFPNLFFQKNQRKTLSPERLLFLVSFSLKQIPQATSGQSIPRLGSFQGIPPSSSGR